MKPQYAVLLPLVAVALFVAAWFSPKTTSVHTDRPVVSVQIARTAYACPLLSGGTAIAGQITAGTSASATVLTAGAKTGTASQLFSDPSRWRSGQAKGGSAVVVTQQGKGSGAVGFSSGAGSGAQGGGNAYARCTGAVSVGWFLGLGAVDQHPSSLQLTNLGSEPAVVDIDLFDSDGKVDAVDASGIVIDANTTRSVGLESLAAGESDVAVRVTGDRGAVAVQALDSGTGTLKGTEFQQPTSAGRHVVLTGVDPSGSHVLKIVNPGNNTANVAVKAVGPNGEFALAGLSDVSVPPGTEKSITLPATVGLKSTALSLTSDVQIAAVVRASNGTDFSFGQAAESLVGPAAFPIGSLGPSLLLSAPGTAKSDAATVQVQVFSTQMTSMGSTTVQVAAGHSVALDPSTIAKGGSYAVVTRQRGGDVYGSVRFATGQQITSFALATAPVTATAPSISMP